MEGRQTLEASGHGGVKAAFQFLTNGTSNPATIIDPWGCVQSVVYSATGNYTITLKPKYKDLRPIATNVSLAMGTPSDSAVYKKSYVASTAVLVVQTFTAGAGAAIAAGADNAINVEITFFDAVDLGMGASYET
jgi:hypothetical protein